jgi:putative transposase
MPAARPLCLTLAWVPLHVVQRRPGDAPCFAGAPERTAYLDALRAAARRCGCSVHAYALMGNHVHLLFTPTDSGGAGQLLRALRERFHPRDGSHFDATPLLFRRYVLACMCYIEQNPVRAGIVRRAGDFRWSSFRANAFGHPDPVITPHPLYCALGRSPEERQTVYRAVFAAGGEPDPRMSLLNLLASNRQAWRA